MSSEVSLETSRLEKFTERILAKLSSVITLSGLLTFLSFAFVAQNDLKSLVGYYLVWIFPFLAAAIATWILTLKKSAAITLQNLTIVESTDPAVNVQYLRQRLKMHNDVYSATNAIYQDTRRTFSMSLSWIVAYLVAYIIAFYYFVFAELPSNPEAVVLTTLVILAAHVFRQWYSKTSIAVHYEGTIQTGSSVHTSGSVGQ